MYIVTLLCYFHDIVAKQVCSFVCHIFLSDTLNCFVSQINRSRFEWCYQSFVCLAFYCLQQITFLNVTDFAQVWVGSSFYCPNVCCEYMTGGHATRQHCHQSWLKTMEPAKKHSEAQRRRLNKARRFCDGAPLENRRHGSNAGDPVYSHSWKRKPRTCSCWGCSRSIHTRTLAFRHTHTQMKIVII